MLHQRESKVEDTAPVDPVNEMTCAYHQLINELGPAKAKELLDQLEFHPVFTAHPTEARRKAVEGKIRRISQLLEAHKLLGRLGQEGKLPSSLQRDRRAASAPPRSH